MDRQFRPVKFSDFVAFVDREVRIILTNPVFCKISDTIRWAPGQRSSGGKTSNSKNLCLLAHVGNSEGPTSETVPQGVKEPSQRADGEQRPQTRKVQPSGIDQSPSHEKNRCLNCGQITPLRIVGHCGGNRKREFNSFCPKSCVLDVYPPNTEQFAKFCRRGKIARLRTVKTTSYCFTYKPS